MTPAVPEAPFAAKPAAQTHASFDVDLGPSAGENARQKAVSADPLEPVSIGPGGTFGMDPLSNRANSTLRHTQSQPAPAPKEDFELQLQPASESAAPVYSTPLTPVTPAPAAQASPAPQDELDALINRAVSGHAPYYTPQEVSAETTLDLPQPTEFETPLTPVPQEPKFDTPLIPVEDEPEPIPVELPQLDMTGRVQGDTMVLSPADLAAQMAADAVPLGTPAPAAVPAAPEAPAVSAPIPTLGGSFSDTGSAVSAAWQSGRSVSEMLDDMLAETPAAPAQPVVEAPAPASDPYTAAPAADSYTAAPAAAPQPYQSAPAMTRPAAETTQSSFTVPRQGEAARVQVSTAVGNSAGAPIHTPPCAAKADPNAMRLPTSEEQPPEPLLLSVAESL